MSTEVVGLVACIQCQKTKDAQKSFRVFRKKRRKVCTDCEQENAREVQTRHLRNDGRGTDIDGDICECSACLKVKAIGEFPKRRTSKDGFSNKCTACTRDNRPVAVKPSPQVNVNVEETLVTKSDVGVSDVIEDGKELIEDVKEIIEDVVEAKEEVLSFWSKVKAFWENMKKKWK